MNFLQRNSVSKSTLANGTFDYLKNAENKKIQVFCVNANYKLTFLKQKQEFISFFL